MRALAVLVLAVIVVLTGACAARIVPAPVVTNAKYPDFIAPSVPAELTGSQAAQSQARAWSFLQAGDLVNADREVQLARRASPSFFPAEATAGYVALARKAPQEALEHFDRALGWSATYPSALAGRGEALVALNREPEALPAFEAALAADPSLGGIGRRIEVLKFRGQERELTAARDAARQGRLDDAAVAYRSAIAGSPGSPFLHRELAAIERQRGNVDGAIEHFRQAAALDPADAGSLADVAMLLEARGDLEGAMRAYEESLAIETSAAVESSRNALRDRLEYLSLPAEYRAIEASSQATRADLAALIGVRLGSLLRPVQSNEAVVLTDVRRNWAENWIIAVARAGVMEPFANHTFQPSGIVRRADLAQAVVRLLPRVAVPEQNKTWQAAARTFSDLSRGHAAYPAAATAVAAGVMTTGPDNSFQPSQPVTGAEAIAAIGRLQALAGPAALRGAGGR